MKTAASSTPYYDQQRIEAVWLARANRLARRPAAIEDGKSALQVLVLGIGNERYGIDLADVAEVLPAVSTTPVPGVSPVFAGVINVNGEIRPVLDLTRLLGMERVPGGDPARVILLRRERRELGLQIDRVEQILSYDSETVQGEGNGNAGLSRYIRGSTKDLLLLLSTEALFAELHTGVTT